MKTFSDQGYLSVKNIKEVLGQDVAVNAIPRSMNGIDLPSDFIFDSTLNNEVESEASKASKIAIGTFMSMAILFTII